MIKHRILCSCPGLQEPPMRFPTVRTRAAYPGTAAVTNAQFFISRRVLLTPHGTMDLDSTVVQVHITFPWSSRLPIAHWPSSVASPSELAFNNWVCTTRPFYWTDRSTAGYIPLSATRIFFFPSNWNCKTRRETWGGKAGFVCLSTADILDCVICHRSCNVKCIAGSLSSTRSLTFFF